MATEYPVTIDIAAIVDSLTNSRDPNTHAATHKTGGTDAVKITELAVADNVTTMNSTTTRPGLLPRLSNVATEYMDGTGNWSAPAGGGGSVTYPGVASVFLNGTGGFSVPAASGSVFRPFLSIGKTNSGADYICDGVDDHVQFQACFNAAPSGSVILILPGTYTFGAGVTVYQNYKDLTIIGLSAPEDVVINVATYNPAIYFNGQLVSNQNLTANAAKDAWAVTVSSTSGIAAGDIIVINNNVKWCPDYYADQTAGEAYLVKSVSGGTINLNEPLLRAYNTSEASEIKVYRPIRMHIENITLSNASGTGEYAGLRLSFAKDSIIKNCHFYNNGLASVRVQGCYNCFVEQNKIMDSIHAGNGYGISVYDAAAYITLRDNRVENCRHCIMSGTSSFEALNRDIVIENNTLIGGDVTGSDVLDCHPSTINQFVRCNKIYPKSTHNAIWDGSKYSIIESNEIHSGYAAICRRGTVTGGYHIIRDNYMDGSAIMYTAVDTSIGDTLIIEGNQFIGPSSYGINLDAETYDHIIIKDNIIKDCTSHGIIIIGRHAGTCISIEDNEIRSLVGNAIKIDHSSYTNGKVRIHGNRISEANRNNTTWSSVYLKNITNASITGNRITDADMNQKYCIQEDTGCDYNRIAFNDFSRFATAALMTVGANDTISYNLGIDI